MKNIVVKRLFCVAMLVLSSFVVQASYELSKLNDNYRIGGRFFIVSAYPNLNYTIYDWTDQSKPAFKFSPIQIPVNKCNTPPSAEGDCHYSPALESLFAGAQNTPQLTQQSTYIFVPDLPFFPDSTSSDDIATQQKNAEQNLKNGTTAPYLVITRDDPIINIYLVSPTMASKLTFNIAEFQTQFLQNQPFYKDLGTLWRFFGQRKINYQDRGKTWDVSPKKAWGMNLGFSFNASNGSFMDSNNKYLLQNAFYLVAKYAYNTPSPFDKSEAQQYIDKRWTRDNIFWNQDDYLNEGFLSHVPYVGLDELNNVKNIINSAKVGNF